PEGAAYLHHVSHDDSPLGIRRHRRTRRGNLQENQDTVLYGFRSLRLHLQAPLAWSAALLPERRCAEEITLHRTGAPRTAIPPTSRRDHPLVRSLAEGREHRHHGRAAGALLAHGCQRVANRDGLAAARDAMDQILSVALGDPV